MKKLLLFFMSMFTLLSFGQLTEGFEGTSIPVSSPPGDDWVLTSGTWKILDNGVGTAQKWQVAPSGQQYQGTRAAYLNRENVGAGMAADWLISPSVTIPTDGQLRFYTKLTQAGIQGSTFTIRISTTSQTDLSTYTTIQTWDEIQLMNGGLLAEQTTYIQKVVDLTPHTTAGATIFVAFVMENNNGDRWLIDNINIDSKCLDNSNLSATPLATSATLNWTSPSTATQWEIEHGPNGFTQGTGTTVTATGTPTYNLTGLSGLTTYCYYVRAVCGSDNASNWSGPHCFTTSALPPGCGGNFIDQGGVAGDYASGEDYIVTICPDNAGDFVTVNFTMFNTESNYDALYVYDSNTTDVNTLILSANGAGNVPGGQAGGYWGTTIPGPFEALNPTGCLTFRFRSDGSVTRPGWTANVTCTPFPTCPKPTNVAFTSISPTSGNITWQHAGTPSQWDIYLVPTGGTAPGVGTTPTYSDVNVTGPAFSYLVNGLNSFTTYDVYVRPRCSVSDIGDWSNISTFTTDPNYCAGDHFYDQGGPTGNYLPNQNTTTTICPDTPGDVVIAFFNTFNLDTNDNLTVYNGSTATGTPIGTYTGTTLPPILISNAPDGCLTFVFTSNGFTNLAGWDASIQCTVPPTCPYPTNLTVTNISDVGATLGWTEAGTANTWQIIVQPAGSGYPTPPYANAVAGYPQTVTGTNSFTATGLNANTEYEFYVIADCGGGDLSFWSGPKPFNTLFPGCGGSVPAGDVIPDAAPVCNLNGYCGNTSLLYNDEGDWPELDTAFCGSIENNSFLTFQATSTTISMDVLVGNCINGSDIQFMIFSAATPGSGPINVIGCDGQMNVGTNSLTFNGLTPGQNYYLMIDGFAGAQCDYSVTVTSGGSTTTDVDITQNDTTICVDETITLDVTGGNGVYNWTPSTGLSAVTGSSVVFTPATPGTYTIQVESTDANALCATSDFVVITVLEKTIPSFSVPGPFCTGATGPTLSDTSNNGVQGVWTPSATIDTSVAGIQQYTFTPDASFQCAEVLVIDVEILGSCTFNSLATAVNIENCETTPPGEYFNTTGSGAVSIGPASNIFTNNDFGTYVQGSGNLLLNGGQLKSFKDISASNVCSATMHYRVYLTSAGPSGTFIDVPLTTVEDCDGTGNFPTGGTCNPGDQKWINNAPLAEDLTAVPAPGDYTVEIYYTLIGDNTSTTTCNDTVLVNNGGNNFKAIFSIQSAPTFTFTNEECGSSNASITVSGFNPGDTYSVTYNDDTVIVGPANFTANSSGEIVIPNLNAGTYNTFNFEINGCIITDATEIVITDFSPSVTQITSNSPVCFGSDIVFTVEGTPNYTLGYTINSGTTQTATFDATGSLTITVVNPAAGNVVLSLINIYNTSCNIPLTDTNTAVVNPLPVINSLVAVNSIACLGNDAVFTINGSANADVTYTINSGANQTLTLDASGSFTLTITAPTSDVTVQLLTVTNVTTGCTTTLSGITATVAVITVPVPTADYTTCADPTTTVEVTSPLISQSNYPSDLFISEVTDSQSGSLTYVEIYNGTGATVDLSGYKLKVHTNGNPTATCDLSLTGMLLNDDVVVIKLSNSANNATVTPDLTFTTCSGVNNNDNIRLATSSNVDIDSWGTTDGSIFTPANGVGYTYRRIAAGTVLPTLTWNPSDWTTLDPEDYSDVGNYTIFISSYEYILNDGTNSTTQTTTTFTGVGAGTYTLVAHDTATGCTSEPITFTINELVNPTFDPIDDLCSGSTDTTLPTTSLEGITGTWSPATINTTTVATSTYTFTPNTGTCASPVDVQVTVIACTIQKGISPNGDGLNDNFDLSGFNVSELKIFNRYGKQVYSKSSYENEWFGQTDSGNDLPDGTYFYSIEFTDMEARTGWIYINRQQ
jgi:gliding motility-associated-like protein